MFQLNKLVYPLCVFLMACSLPPKEDANMPPKIMQPQATPAVQANVSSAWGYDGIHSPNNWGDLSPDYGLCKNGLSQSPINLVWSRPQGSPDINFNYKASSAQITDTGTTIMINVASGNYVAIRGEQYELKSISFHSSSEHTLSGNSLPLEIQYVHQSSSGQVAIVAFFAIEGPRNQLVDKLWRNIPQGKNIEQVLTEKINVAEMLPKKNTHYHYVGSLTTPPCVEGVHWNVLNTPITLSRDQILAFRQLYPHNNRPVQPLNKRKVINY